MATQVIIVGAGPVGLTLAVDLGRRGIRCTLIEQKEAPQFLPKMERCNARTMEMYRRIGLAETIRAAGLRSDVPMDVFIVLSLTEPHDQTEPVEATFVAESMGLSPRQVDAWMRARTGDEVATLARQPCVHRFLALMFQYRRGMLYTGMLRERKLVPRRCLGLKFFNRSRSSAG
jgi:flavin-dependent dehydrogenase